MSFEEISEMFNQIGTGEPYRMSELDWFHEYELECGYINDDEPEYSFEALLNRHPEFNKEHKYFKWQAEFWTGSNFTEEILKSSDSLEELYPEYFENTEKKKYKMNFTVSTSWDVEIEADSPKEAYEKAVEQLTVTDLGNDEFEIFHWDLENMETEDTYVDLHFGKFNEIKKGGK